MFYVYILKTSEGSYYVGYTKNLDRRIKEHITGNVSTTKGKKLVKLVCAIMFSSKKKAIEFEKYLKTGSGIAFRNRHLV